MSETCWHGIDTEEEFCLKCADQEMLEIAASRGIKLASYELSSHTPESVRTRYAKPGQRTGNGVVRLVSPAQVKYIKRLMTERDTRNLVRLPGSEDIENMSLAGARDLIDRLLGCPELPQKPVREATLAQISYIKSLIARKGAPDVAHAIYSFEGASKAIGILKQMSDKPQAKAESLKVGIYRHTDGRIVQVKPNRQGTRMYGKLYNAEYKSWEYMPGLLNGLTSANRMSIEECQALSVEMGSCCLCGRDLTATVDGVPPSQRYIGPICAGKLS